MGAAAGTALPRPFGDPIGAGARLTKRGSESGKSFAPTGLRFSEARTPSRSGLRVSRAREAEGAARLPKTASSFVPGWRFCAELPSLGAGGGGKPA